MLLLYKTLNIKTVNIHLNLILQICDTVQIKFGRADPHPPLPTTCEIMQKLSAHKI